MNKRMRMIVPVVLGAVAVLAWGSAAEREGRRRPAGSIGHRGSD